MTKATRGDIPVEMDVIMFNAQYFLLNSQYLEMLVTVKTWIYLDSTWRAGIFFSIVQRNFRFNFAG